MAKDTSPSERVRTSFQQLSVAANQLNAVSDELGKSITQLDAALKKLNLGVPAWVTIRSGGDAYPGSDYYWSEDLGYDKIDTKWGIAIRERSGHESSPDGDDRCEVWLFDEAPRRLRIIAVEKIPDLLEKLTAHAGATAEKIKHSTAYVQELAAAITPSEPKPDPKGKQTGGRQ